MSESNNIESLIRWLKGVIILALAGFATIIGWSIASPPMQAAHAWTITILIVALAAGLGFAIWGLVRAYEHDRPNL